MIDIAAATYKIHRVGWSSTQDHILAPIAIVRTRCISKLSKVRAGLESKADPSRGIRHVVGHMIHNIRHAQWRASQGQPALSQVEHIALP